ncbi:MAG: glycosyltransferase, partial [Polyangiales bacterium]
PFGSVLDAPVRSGGITVHPAGGGSLFGAPGAAVRVREAPWRLVGAASFAVGVRVRMRAIGAGGAVDRVIAHWIFPSAWPLCAGVGGALEVVAHGADVRALLAMPARVREGIVGSLLARGATFQFVAERLLGDLSAGLGPEMSARLRGVARVEPAPIAGPDVRGRAAELRASLGLAGGEKLAVCVGRLVASKRIELAIAAAGAGVAADGGVRLAADGGVRLAVVGEGPERARLAAAARAGGVRVVWLGALERDAALAWIAAADVLVHPSASEGAPTVVREARALGTPVAACASGDVARWAARDAGIVVAEPSAEGIARAMRRALSIPRG